jgi:myo-inositol-1-phosphate synthase
MDLPTEDAPAETVARLESQMKAFVEQNGLSSLIVVNVSSTEPVNAAVQSILEKGGDDSKKLNSLWDKALNKKCSQSSESSLPASSLYGYAAMKNGWTFINFTPSTGVPIPLGDLWSEQYGSAYMGFDGKTGETLMKSVLAPMFRNRNFNVMSWVGHNIFGNLDAVVLDDPANKTAKVASKDRLLGEILGYRPQTLVTIERINSLGDWKTAWDHIHFQGFLGTPMALQFTWEGCDSILAAPLVLDLSRLALTARRRGQTGRLDFLSSFFKSPQGASTHDFARQYLALYDWVMGESR